MGVPLARPGRLLDRGAGRAGHRPSPSGVLSHETVLGPDIHLDVDLMALDRWCAERRRPLRQRDRCVITEFILLVSQGSRAHPSRYDGQRSQLAPYEVGVVSGHLILARGQQRCRPSHSPSCPGLKNRRTHSGPNRSAVPGRFAA